MPQLVKERGERPSPPHPVARALHDARRIPLLPADPAASKRVPPFGIGDEWTLRVEHGDDAPQHPARIARHALVVLPVLGDDFVVSDDRMVTRQP